MWTAPTSGPTVPGAPLGAPSLLTASLPSAPGEDLGSQDPPLGRRLICPESWAPVPVDPHNPQFVRGGRRSRGWLGSSLQTPPPTPRCAQMPPPLPSELRLHQSGSSLSCFLLSRERPGGLPESGTVLGWVSLSTCHVGPVRLCAQPGPGINTEK